MSSYKKMVSIFIDIVGYQNITDFNKKHELHRLFHEEVIIHEKRQEEIPHVIYDRKVFGFSDCAYFFFYYKDDIEDSRKNNTNLIYIAAYNVSLTILRLMSKGYLVRGGVSFGNVFLDELGFFGPAVERAYEIESKEADVPRLQFDLGIGKEVFDWEHTTDNKNSDLLDMFHETPFVSEFDGEAYFVNPFNVLQRSTEYIIGKDILKIEQVKSTLLAKIEKDLITYSNTPKIIKKLKWIQNYLLSKKLLLRTDIAPISVSSTIG